MNKPYRIFLKSVSCHDSSHSGIWKETIFPESGRDVTQYAVINQTTGLPELSTDAFAQLCMTDAKLADLATQHTGWTVLFELNKYDLMSELPEGSIRVYLTAMRSVNKIPSSSSVYYTLKHKVDVSPWCYLHFKNQIHFDPNLLKLAAEVFPEVQEGLEHIGQPATYEISVTYVVQGGSPIHYSKTVCDVEPMDNAKPASLKGRNPKPPLRR